MTVFLMGGLCMGRARIRILSDRADRILEGSGYRLVCDRCGVELVVGLNYVSKQVGRGNNKTRFYCLVCALMLNLI
jgi:hypothetical protein